MTLFLSVSVPTPFITVSNADTLYAGTTLSLTCDYTLSPSVDTTPQTAVTWMVGGIAVDTSPGRISTDGATLSFSPLATSDTGNYTCTLTVTTSQIHVTVQGPEQSEEEGIIVEGNYTEYNTIPTSYKPLWVLPPALPDPQVIFSSENSTVTAGDTHTLQCTVTDIPYLAVSPTVELIGPGDIVLATDMSFTVTYTLDPVMTSHAGQYTCRASVMIASVSVNVSGQSTSNITVQSKQVQFIMYTYCHVH